VLREAQGLAIQHRIDIEHQGNQFRCGENADNTKKMTPFDRLWVTRSLVLIARKNLELALKAVKGPDGIECTEEDKGVLDDALKAINTALEGIRTSEFKVVQEVSGEEI